MKKVDREFIKEMKRKDLEHHRVIRLKYDDGDRCRTSKLFSDTDLGEGGWYHGRKWMTAKFLVAAETRWVKHSYDTGKQEPDVKDDWIPHQCGGCCYFAALDSDYGICCNEESPNDGRITFEHGGCIKHSDFGE